MINSRDLSLAMLRLTLVFDLEAIRGVWGKS